MPRITGITGITGLSTCPPLAHLLSTVLLGALVSLAGCNKTDNDGKGPAEVAGKQLDKAAVQAGKELKQAAEITGKAIENAGAKMQEKAKEAQK